MPSLYPPTMAQQMPLTPPEYYGGYSDTGTGSMQHLAQDLSCGTLSELQHDMGRIELRSFPKLCSGYANAQFAQPTSGKENDQRGARASLRTSAFEKSLGSYSSSRVPLLPPIRVSEGLSDGFQGSLKSTQVNTPSREEKVVGGVAAHLDYEMDQMADFVAEMAQGMYDLYESRIYLADIDIIRSVNPKSPVHSAFRKYVSQVLSSTRLPSSTILLSLYYLSSRISILSMTGRYSTGSGQIYRMLTTALLLGSKFLDDNTFQNRSWSEVSNIPVRELNVLEIEWLVATSWDMHIDPEDPQGFMLWRRQWERWQARKVEMSLDSLKLTPLHTNIQRQRPLMKALPPTPLYPPTYNEATYAHVGFKEQPNFQWHTSQRDQLLSLHSKPDYSPPSIPGTGPATPEWYTKPSDVSYAQPGQSQSTRSVPSLPQFTPSSFQQTSYQLPFIRPQVRQNWNGHMLNCYCSYCSLHHDKYLVAPAFGPQPVIG